VHEGACPDVAVRTGQQAAVDVAGPARQRQGAVDDAGGRLVDEDLGGLRLGEQGVELAGRAVRGRVGSVVLVDQRRRAGQNPARGGEVDGVVGHLHPRPRVAVHACGEAAACGVVGRLGDAERRGGMEQPGHQVALDVRQRVAGAEAAAHGGVGQHDAVQRDRVAAGRAHPEPLPVVVHHDARRPGRHHCVGVAVGAVVVGVADRHVQIGRGRGHRAEHLAAVDPPAGFRAGGARARTREVLTRLADGGGEHDAVAGDLLERRREGASLALGPGGDRPRAAALHVQHRNQVHVHADRDGGVAARETTRRDDEVVRGVDAEPAELGGDGRGEDAGGLEDVDRLEGVGAGVVVLGRAGGELAGELLGDGNEAGSGVSTGFEFDGHGGISVRSQRARPEIGRARRASLSRSSPPWPRGRRS
jgi:hypothetical protein